MTYKPTITNDEANTLPAAQFRGEIIIVDSDDQVEAMCQYLSEQPILGFDTETRPSFKSGVSNRVALLQLSSSERC